MNKTSLALTIVAGLWGWIAHADESAKILQLWPNCTALLNQDINWKLMDIITCPNRESLDQSIRIMPSETITYWDFTQNVSYMIAQDLPIGQEVTVSLEWLPPFTIWKSENKDGPYYYSIAWWYTQLVPTGWFDCYRSTDSLTNSEIMVCDDWERIPEDFIKAEFGESWTVVFPNGHEIHFDDTGILWIKVRDEIPL